MKNQTFVISGLVGFGWQSKRDLLTIAVFTAELQQVLASKRSNGLNELFASLEFLIPDHKIKWDCRFDLRLTLRMAWYSRESEDQSKKTRILLNGSQLSFLNTTNLSVYNSTGRSLFLCSNCDLVRITVSRLVSLACS